MRMPNTIVELNLSNIHELFVASEFDPFKPDMLYDSGIDTVLGRLDPLKMIDRLKLTISLPSEQNETGLAEQVKIAVQNYCDYHVYENKKNIDIIKRTGRRQLIFALPFMVIALAISSIAAFYTKSTTNLGLQALGGIIASLFSVASWIIVWDPIEALSYGWRPLIRENRLYQLIGEAELEIIPQES